MEEVLLGMDNRIGIRFSGMSFPSDMAATVEFELYSMGHQVGDDKELLVKLSQEVPRYKMDNTGLPDYDGMVKAAAAKLERDFKYVLDILRKSYSSGG